MNEQALLPIGLFDSEEDVKEKIVSKWLYEHGFTSSQLSLEARFEIQIGRSTHTIEPDKTKSVVGRADYLVRSIDGRNLFIIEVKASDQQIDDKVSRQGLSYARLLKEGGIAPFVLVTNGRESKLFDSITGSIVTEVSASPHAANGFRVSVDDLNLRSEALGAFVSLTPENLLTFCRGAVGYHMTLLKSVDLESDKKYIPQLCVRRREAERRIRDLINEPGESVALVIGSPQVGKTNFLCQLAEDLLDQGRACLFYPAISIRKGLLEEMQEDFEWSFHDTSSASQIINKLRIILDKINLQLTIIIDGWNEASHQLALQLNNECKRLQNTRVQFVISSTSSSVARLLFDQAKNPCFIADATQIRETTIPLIETSPHLINSATRVVFVARFNESETEEAYKIYSEAYNVKVPREHRQSVDPFLVGLAMREAKNSELSDTIDEPGVLQRSLDRKIARANCARQLDAKIVVRKTAELLSEATGSVEQTALYVQLGLPHATLLDSSLIEAGLLTIRNTDGVQLVDFYYSRERDYAISIWVGNWHSASDSETIRLMVEAACEKTNSQDAMSWFLTRSAYGDTFRKACGQFKAFSAHARKMLIRSLIETITAEDKMEVWRSEVLETALKDSETRVRLEAVKLLALTAGDEELAKHVTPDRDLIEGLLTLDEDFPFTKGEGGEIVLQALRSIHWESNSDADGDEFTAVLADLMVHDRSAVRRAAAKALGFVNADIFFAETAECLKVKQFSLFKEDFREGVVIARQGFGERYYGSMCRGLIDCLEDNLEDKQEEYDRIAPLLDPIIFFYGKEECSTLVNILDDLCVDPEQRATNKIKVYYDPNQRELDL